MKLAFLALLRQTVTHEPFSALGDQYGDSISYGSSTSMRARVTPTTERIVSYAGRDVTASCVAWIDAGDTVIGNRDRITLPDGSQPEILRVTRFADENGQWHHTKVYFA